MYDPLPHFISVVTRLAVDYLFIKYFSITISKITPPFLFKMFSFQKLWLDCSLFCNNTNFQGRFGFKQFSIFNSAFKLSYTKLIKSTKIQICNNYKHGMLILLVIGTSPDLAATNLTNTFPSFDADFK